jgi:hypothetical protein
MLATGESPDPLLTEPEVRRLTVEEVADPVHQYIRMRDNQMVFAISTLVIWKAPPKPGLP